MRRLIDLDTFLDELPSEAAAKARAAAARIDELEHAAQRIGSSDRTYMRLFALTGVLFLLAAGLLISGTELFRGGAPHLMDVMVLLMAGSFPAMVLVYSVKMKERTKIDRQKFEIIENYFLPYGAVYLPPGPDRTEGTVALSEGPDGWNRRPEDDKKFKKPGWYW